MAVIVCALIGAIYENASDTGSKVIFSAVVLTKFAFKLHYEMRGHENLELRYPPNYIKSMPLSFLGLFYSSEICF